MLCVLTRTIAGDDLVLGFNSIFRQQFDLARQHIDAAVLSRPNDSEFIAWVGLAFMVLGELEEARRLVNIAKERNPLNHGYFHSIEGRLAYLEGDYSGSIEAFRLSTGYRDRMWDVATAAASMAQLGLMKDSSEAASRVQEIVHRRSAEGQEPTDFKSLFDLRLGRFKRPEDRKHLTEGLKKAGLI